MRELDQSLRRDLRELELRLEAKIDKAQAEMKLWFIGTTLALAASSWRRCASLRTEGALVSGSPLRHKRR